MLALGGEELGPGNNLGVLFEQRASLALGHAAPDAELNAVVKCIGAARGDDRAVAANHGRFALRGTPDEQFVGIRGSTQCLRNPGDAGLGGPALNRAG